MNLFGTPYYALTTLLLAAEPNPAGNDIPIGTQILIRVREQDPDPNWAFQTESAVADYLKAVIAGGGELSLRGPAKLVTLINDETPFLREKIVGRPVWHAEITNIGWPSDNRVKALAQTFDAFVDAEKGQLIRIVSRWPEDAGDPPRLPRSEWAAEYMTRAGRERYYGFPEERPAVTFREALDICAKGGTGAKQIDAQYVLQSEMDKEVRPVWAITFRHSPSTRRRADGMFPRPPLDHMRHIVDARSGKRLGGTTSPPAGPPDPWEDDKSKAKNNDP